MIELELDEEELVYLSGLLKSRLQSTISRKKYDQALVVERLTAKVNRCVFKYTWKPKLSQEKASSLSRAE